MSKEERLRWQGKLLEKQKKARGLEISIKGLRDSLRMSLDPHEEVGSLDGETIANIAMELAEKLAEYDGLDLAIKGLKGSLGMD